MSWFRVSASNNRLPYTYCSDVSPQALRTDAGEGVRCEGGEVVLWKEGTGLSFHPPRPHGLAAAYTAGYRSLQQGR